MTPVNTSANYCDSSFLVLIGQTAARYLGLRYFGFRYLGFRYLGFRYLGLRYLGLMYLGLVKSDFFFNFCFDDLFQAGAGH